MPAVETMNPTTDDFAAMLEESFAGAAMIEGRVVPATVTAVGNDFITVDVGLKTEGRIPAKEFASRRCRPDRRLDRRSLPGAHRERARRRSALARQGEA